MRRFLAIIVFLASAVWFTTLCTADTFKLTTGEELSGEALPTSANEMGIQIKVGDGQYKRVQWGQFSQDDLKKFAQYKKLEELVEPFIEITQEEKIARTEVKIKPAPRLDRPEKQNLLGAMISSSVGVFVLFVLWAATIYAGYEVAIFRARPPLLVAGLAAIPFLGVLSPIVFLALPTNLPPPEPEAAAAEATAAAAATAATPAGDIDPDNPMAAVGAAHPSGLKLSHETAPKAAKSAVPEPVVFQRGQFTFNRRFFETKFAGFFPAVKRDAERDMVLVIKSARGEYVGTRISRIAANDLHLQVHQGGASSEVMIPFVEVREVVLRHKDAKA